MNNPSDACRAAKMSLLAGENNLRRVAMLITANRELCKEKTGKADLPQWLAGYEGLHVPSRDRWCAPSAKTWQVVEQRKQLLQTLVPRARAAKAVRNRGRAGRDPTPVEPAPVHGLGAHGGGSGV